MTVLRDLDERFHNIVESMRHNSRSYAAIMKQRRSSATNGGPVVIGADKDARGALIGYRRDYQAAMEQAERKLETSQTVLDQFNSHYARLEKALEKWEDEGKTGSRKRRRTCTDDQTHSRRRTRQRTGADGGTSFKRNGGGSDDEDQTPYCICQQVSYGEMVACDNENCPIEWFHLACVGLIQPPKGKWYCSQCLGAGYGRSSPAVSSNPRKRGSTPSLDTFDDEFVDIDGEEDDPYALKKEGVGAARRRRKMEAIKKVENV
ncbi:hypothetical protein SpCBS45565_g06980 [Spizellomyces sp. 'palustris']|nr:hypothetical protein SpCBS45565_g06980 [Spizellomyces sp. 'palustris']